MLISAFIFVPQKAFDFYTSDNGKQVFNCLRCRAFECVGHDYMI